MSDHEYIAVYEEAWPPDPVPEPVRLLRTRVADGRTLEETWTRPGEWRRTNYLTDLGFGHGDGEPRSITAEEFRRWQAVFTREWQDRAGGPS